MNYFPHLITRTGPFFSCATLAILLTQPALAQVSESEIESGAADSGAADSGSSAPSSADTAAPANDATDSAASSDAGSDARAAQAREATEASGATEGAATAAVPAAIPLTGADPEPTAPLAEEPTAEATVSEETAVASAEDFEQFKKPPTPFDQGRLRVGAGLGWSSTSRTDWLILGAGLGFYVLDGLEVGVDSTFWVIGDPFIATLTPGIRYVFVQLPSVKPYVGVFYRHYFVADDWDDTDAIGGRLGVNFMLSQSAYMGGGIVYEHFLDDDLFSTRDQFYPEITFGFAF